MGVRKKQSQGSFECFTECQVEGGTYRNRPSKVITVFTVILVSTWKDDRPEAQRGEVTCLRLHSQCTLQGLKSDTPQWVPFLLLREIRGDEG